MFNDGRTDVSVPNWTGDLMMYARDSSQIREWIANGVTAARAKSLSWQEERDKGVLEMPAFGRRLSREQIDDLVAYIMAIQNHDTPSDSLAIIGQARIDSLGCIGCHGAGGRLSRPNPGSFKGYVPSWSGPDFPDLVRDRQEFDQWVTSGISKRFENNPLARYFLDKAVLKMPAFREHLKPGDLDAIWAYIFWLRAEASSGTAEKGK